jgi:MFS family permease
MKGFRMALGALLMGRGRASGGGERWYLSFFFSKLAGGASAPLVPLFVIVVLGGGVGAVAITIVSVSAATVPAYILWGDYSDRTHRRRLPLVVGMAMTSIAFLVMGLADSMWMFIAGNVMYGFFLAATVPTSTILIMEHNPEAIWGEAVGRFAKVSGMGWMTGMALGAVYFASISHFLPQEPSMRVLMLLCGLTTAIAYALAMFWINEPRFHIDRRWLEDQLVIMRTWTFERSRHIPSKLVYALRPRIMRKARTFLPGWGRDLDMYLVATFILFTGVMVFYVPFPVMLSQELLLTSSQIFLVYLASAVAAAAMYAWAGREVDQLGNRKAQLFAWGARVVIFSAFALVLAAAGRELFQVAFGLSLLLNGLAGAMFAVVSVAGITTALDLSPRRGKGEAVGAYNSVTGLGMIVGGLLGGVVASVAGYLAVALVTCAISLVAVIILLKVHFTRTES